MIVSPLLLAAATLIGMALILWAYSLRVRRVDFVDVFWPLFHLIPGLVYVGAAAAGAVGSTGRQILLASLLSIWAVRLATHLATRSAGAAEDARYRAIRRHNDPGFGWKSLYLIFGLQALMAGFISLMLMPAAFDPTPLGWLDVAWALIVSLGIVYQTVADLQLAAFKQQGSRAVLDRGLWRYSRHPNYFGEWCVWLGFTCFALNGGGWWSIAGLALLTLLLMRVSGVRLMESTIIGRRPGYAEYAARTNAFWPAFRPDKSAATGQTTVAAFFVAGLVCTAPHADAVSSQRYAFEARVGDRKIGIHEFEVVSNGSSTAVVSRADFEVRLLLIKAFSYLHVAEERYDGPCLTNIASETDVNGKRYALLGQRTDDAFTLRVNDVEQTLPACVMAFAYWDARMLDQERLLNPQTGAFTTVEITPLGMTEMPAAGTVSTARGYRLSGPKLDMILWYDSTDGRWVGLESTTENGRTLTYRLVDYRRELGPTVLADSGNR